MTVLIPYLIKLSISLAVVYLFYQLFLRRLTFYNWNRWYLLIYSFLSFFIPFVNIYPVLEKNNWDNSGMLELIPVVSYQVNSLSIPVEETSIPWNYQDWTMLLIGIGAVIMLGRLLIQQLSFIRIRRSSTLLLNDRIKVYQVNKNIIPFSYGNSIFVNQHQHSQEELKEIIRHEFIHVKQKHTLDILWAELLCIFNWYNPFAWLIRKSIRQNLEFIADNKVLQNGIDKKEYQYLLLKVIGVSQFSVATQFNFSSLKKRIAMMNKIKSAKVHLLKFLFMLPLMAVLLLSFRNNFYKNGDKTVYWVSGIVLDQSTNLPLNDVLISESNSGKKTYTDKQGYFKLQLPYEGTNINFAVSFDIPGYKPAKRGMRSSEFQFENNNGNIEFVYLAKASGPRTHSEYYHGEPDYSIVRKRFNDHIAVGERDKRIDALVGNSNKPIWIIDGIPYVVGYGLKAWFDKEEVEASPEFKISVDGKLMSMDEANTTINRSEIVGVAAYGVETSRKELGVAMNVFVLYLDKPVKDNKVDTTPTKRKLPSNVSSISVKNDIATVKLKNGTVETYDLNKEEELERFEKKYGKMPEPPTPPAPPLAPTPRTEEHVRVEQKENSKGYIVTVADNGECVVIIKDKDKKIVKAMLLTEWNDHEFENAAKYGEIPSAPPVKAAIPALPLTAVPPTRAKVSGVEIAPVPAKPTVPPIKGRVNGVEIVPVPARPKVPPPGFDDGLIVAPPPEKFYQKPVAPVPKSEMPSVRFRNINITGDGPLFIIDGVKQPRGEEVLYTINPNDIESIDVIKDGTAKALYGEQAVGGVILIKTKKGSGNQPWNIDHLENFEGLIILDGDEVNKEQLNERVKTLDIESINVLKNEEATNTYGEKGKKGVMLIRTKAKKDPTIVSGGQAGQSRSSKSAATINRTIAGIIIDEETRKPISGAKVYSPEMAFETTTDKNGYYMVHINKQPTVKPRIFITHPQYLPAMMFDGSYDKQKEIDHTLVLFMGIHKGNSKVIREYTTSSMAQQYTVSTNKTLGYEQLNEILEQWLKRYDHQRDRAQAEEYIDQVDVNEGMMNWTLVKNSKKHPLYLLEKKIISKDYKEVEKLISKSDIYMVEFIGRGDDLLKQYGDDAKDGIINFITKANKDNQTVRLVPEKKISEEELAAMLVEAAKLNVLYVGIENPLKIQAENIPANDIEVRMEDGIVFQRNGVFYAIPQDNEGGNSKIDIYKKLKNGQTQLLNSRYFRVRALPQQTNSFVMSR